MSVIIQGGTPTYVGATLGESERNGYNDSDFYAKVWDEATQSVREFEIGSTRYGNGTNFYVTIDATDEVKAKVAAYNQTQHEKRLAKIAEHEAPIPFKGKRVRVCTSRKAQKGAVGTVLMFSRKPSYVVYSGPSFHRKKGYGDSMREAIMQGILGPWWDYSASEYQVMVKLDGDKGAIWTIGASTVKVIPADETPVSIEEWLASEKVAKKALAAQRKAAQKAAADKVIADAAAVETLATAADAIAPVMGKVLRGWGNPRYTDNHFDPIYTHDEEKEADALGLTWAALTTSVAAAREGRMDDAIAILRNAHEVAKNTPVGTT